MERLRLVQDAYKYWSLNQFTDLTDSEFIVLTDGLYNYLKTISDNAMVGVAYVLKKVGSLIGLPDVFVLFNKVGLKGGISQGQYFADRLKSWLHPKEIPCEDPVIMEKVEVKMRQQFVDAKGKAFGRVMSFEEFVANPTLWATSGAVDVKKMVGPGWLRNKGGLAFSVSTAAILKHVYDVIDAGELRWGVITKQEPGAPRAVILTDIVTHLIMSYISEYVEAMLDNHRNYYNWKNTEERFEFWRRQLLYAKGSYWFYDLDFSAWDESMTASKMRMCLRIVRNWLSGNIGQPEMLELMDALIELLEHAEVGVDGEDGVEWIKVINGLARGQRS